MGNSEYIKHAKKSYVESACFLGNGRCRESLLIELVGSDILDEMERDEDIARSGGYVYSWAACAKAAYKRDSKREVVR